MSLLSAASFGAGHASQAPVVAIVGAGGHGREVADIVAAALGPTAIFGIADDGQIATDVLDLMGLPFLGTCEQLRGRGLRYLVGIGDARIRAEVAARLEHEVPAPAVVHPSATCGSLVTLGSGTVVGPGATITTNVAIGRHCYIGPRAVVSHDCILGDFCTVLPGALVAGGVELETGATVGMGAMVRENLAVGEWAFIGAGAVVIRNVAAHTVVAGVPARPLQRSAPIDHR